MPELLTKMIDGGSWFHDIELLTQQGFLIKSIIPLEYEKVNRGGTDFLQLVKYIVLYEKPEIIEDN